MLVISLMGILECEFLKNPLKLYEILGIIKYSYSRVTVSPYLHRIINKLEI